MDYPTTTDGANTNNTVTVLPRDADKADVRERLLSPTGRLTDAERGELAQLLCPWGSHDRSLHRARARGGGGRESGGSGSDSGGEGGGNGSGGSSSAGSAASSRDG